MADLICHRCELGVLPWSHRLHGDSCLFNTVTDPSTWLWAVKRQEDRVEIQKANNRASLKRKLEEDPRQVLLRTKRVKDS